MTNAKFGLYGITIVCYLVAGILDLVERNTKIGILAIGFGILNFVMFFYRSGD